jgi:iron complex outermembrane recepter protein
MNGRSERLKGLAAGLAAGVALLATGAHAQTGETIELDTVVVEGGGGTGAGSAGPERANGPVDGVTAKRSATGTKTVVTADQIEILAAQNPSEALRYNAGVQVERFGNDPRYDWIKIRGFDTPIFLNGLQLPNSTYATPRYEPYGIERLEVLKGPASVLYGQSPPGGIVNLVTKKPLDETQREVRFQVGNHDRFQASFDVTGPIDDEKTLLYRLIGLGRLSDTEVDFVNDDRAFVAPSFTFAPNPDTTLTIEAFYIKDDAKSLQFLPSQGTLNANPFGQIPRDLFTGEPGFDDFEREQFGIGYEFEHHFDANLSVKQNLRYTDVDVNLPVVRGFGFAGANNFRNLTRRAVVFDDRIDGLTLDNQVLWTTQTGALDHQILAGLDYRQFDSGFSTRLSTIQTLDVFNPVYGRPFAFPPVTGDIGQSVEQVGLYLQDQIRYDRLVLLLSGRHDWADNETTNRLTDVERLQSDSEFTGRAGLLLELDNGFSPYVSYSTLFQPTVGIAFSGGLSAPAFSPTGEPFEPTTGDQVEAGLKFQPPGTNSLFTASLFRIEQENLLVARVGGGQEQVGAVAVNGFEFEAKVDMTDRLALIASYSYLDSEITNALDSSVIGNQLPVTPEHQAAAFANYTFGSGTLDGLSLGAGVRYFGKHQGNQANTLELPSYTLVDAVAKYDLGALDNRFEGAELAVNANNLFDKDYVATCGDLSTCYYGNGRQVFGTLTYRW